MPPKSSQSGEDKKDQPEQSTFSRQSEKRSNFFSVPAPIKQLFDVFPIVTYAPNALPQRTPKSSRIPSLYVFSTDADAAAGKPSFNPTCLKWQVCLHSCTFRRKILIMMEQTFLNIAGIDHRLISSNNHASPTGNLPFLLPPAPTNPSQDALPPIPANKLVTYATERGARISESSSMRYDAYQSLLDHRIRNAWVSYSLR